MFGKKLVPGELESRSEFEKGPENEYREFECLDARSRVFIISSLYGEFRLSAFSWRIRRYSALKGIREHSPSPISASKIDDFSVSEFGSPFLNRSKPGQALEI